MKNTKGRGRKKPAVAPPLVSVTSDQREGYELPAEIVEAVRKFHEYHSATRLSRNLRSLLLEFLMYDGSAEAEYLRELAIDLCGLYSILDSMEDNPCRRPAAQGASQAVPPN